MIRSSVVVYVICVKPPFHNMSCKDSSHISHDFLILSKLAINGFPCFLCFSKLSQVMRNAVPCHPRFSMLFEDMKRRSYYAPHAVRNHEKMLYHASHDIRNHKKVLYHGLHAIHVLLMCPEKYSHASPCFCRAQESKGSTE